MMMIRFKSDDDDLYMSEDDNGRFVEYDDYIAEIERLKQELTIEKYKNTYVAECGLEEMERLKKENKLFLDSNLILTRRITKAEEQLKREAELHGEKSVLIKRLREALKKCNPLIPCRFCGANPYFVDKNGMHETHTEDCEYIQLTEGKDD